MDFYSRDDKLSRKLDYLPAIRHTLSTSFLPAQQVECPIVHQFFEFRYEQVHQDQTQIAYELRNNLFLNDYNLGWGAQSNFSWNPHPVGTPVT